MSMTFIEMPRLGRCAAVLGMAALAACSRGGQPAADSPAAPDTTAEQPRLPAADSVRGTVAEVGSTPVTSIVVRPRTGRPVTITGDLAREIGRAAGAEVWVSGVRSAEGAELAAERYAVRTVDGEVAIDGVVASDGDRLVLMTPAGRRPIARPPDALRGMIGARVWVVGSPDHGITSYGVLRPAP